MKVCEDRYRNTKSQGFASIIDEVRKQEMKAYYHKVYEIDTQTATRKMVVDQRLDEAVDCLNEVYEFIGSPEHILGNAGTKHGEIAEHVDVAFHNARRIMKGASPDATFDHVGRTAPEDYYVSGKAVQSKYINGSSQSLKEVLKHLNKYKNIGFGLDSSYYVIPQDQYKEIQQVLSGNTENLSSKKVNTIKNKVHEIEIQTGKPFDEVVKSGNVDYAGVQQGAVHKTLRNETENLRAEAEHQASQIDTEGQAQKDLAQENLKPTWQKAAAAAGISAGISGGFSLAAGIQRKCSAGKHIQDFTIEDWKEIGLDTTAASVEGGISGLSIYWLTEKMSCPSPLAAAGVSLTIGVAELTYEYVTDIISKQDFIAGCQTVGINSILCAVGAWIGGELIPIPILGSVIGSAIAGNICKEIIGQGILAAKLQAAESVHRSTVSMLQAVNVISENQQVVASNLKAIRNNQKQLSKTSDDFWEQIGGLL